MRMEQDLRIQLARILREAHRASQIDLVQNKPAPPPPRLSRLSLKRFQFRPCRAILAFGALVAVDLMAAPLADATRPPLEDNQTFQEELHEYQSDSYIDWITI